MGVVLSASEARKLYWNVNKGANVILCCDGLLKTNKQVRDYTSSEEEERPKERKKLSKEKNVLK